MLNLVGSALLCSVPQGLVPREDNASDHVLELLKPYTTENGGPLEVERVHFTPGRGNVIIKYQGQSVKSIGHIRASACAYIHARIHMLLYDNTPTTSSPEGIFASKNSRGYFVISTDDARTPVCRSSFRFHRSIECFFLLLQSQYAPYLHTDLCTQYQYLLRRSH